MSERHNLRKMQPRERREFMELVARCYLSGTPLREMYQQHENLPSRWIARRLYLQCLKADGDNAPDCKHCPGKKVVHRGACRGTKPRSPYRPPRRLAEVSPPQIIETQCPCCGSNLGRETLAIDINMNTVSYQGRAWRLPPQLAVFVHMLAKNWPKAVSSYDMRIAIWGACDGPDKDGRILAVYASKVRGLFRATGIEIRRGSRPNDYALSLPDGGCAQCDATVQLH